jgi:putative endonuclease
MNNTVETGKYWEDRAASYLTDKGYKIIHQNYRFKHGEIDLITMKDNVLVFAEVKYRQNADFGYPEEFVTKQKAKMVKMTASHYIFKVNWQKNIRFDIISILGKEIEHFEDAF